jgi:hypothetical protein
MKVGSIMKMRNLNEYFETASLAFYWGQRLAFEAPKLAGHALGAVLQSRADKTNHEVQILIGTHHKVLTVFFHRTFRTFGFLTNRSVSRGTGSALNLTTDIVLDHHSYFDGFRAQRPYCGLHVRRDPRDVIVSSAQYHEKAGEAWLHVPRSDFGGKTYQEHIRSLKTMEDKLILEIDHAGGQTIADMRSWKDGRSGFLDLRYEDLVSKRAVAVFSEVVEHWPLSAKHRALLIELFDYFSIGGAGSRRNSHIRNPSPEQWRQHFTPAVIEHFTDTFGSVVEELGYRW